MGNWIQDMFGTDKALIGLCHFLALPGDPLYDEDGGMEKVYEAARTDGNVQRNFGENAAL